MIVYLDFQQSFATLGFLRVVKPSDFDDHVASPRLPEALNSSDVRQMRSSGWQEHGAVSDLEIK